MDSIVRCFYESPTEYKIRSFLAFRGIAYVHDNIGRERELECSEEKRSCRIRHRNDSVAIILGWNAIVRTFFNSGEMRCFYHRSFGGIQGHT